MTYGKVGDIVRERATAARALRSFVGMHWDALRPRMGASFLDRVVHPQRLLIFAKPGRSRPEHEWLLVDVLGLPSARWPPRDQVRVTPGVNRHDRGLWIRAEHRVKVGQVLIIISRFWN